MPIYAILKSLLSTHELPCGNLFQIIFLLTTYGLPCNNLKLRNDHFWPNHVMPHGDQGLGS